MALKCVKMERKQKVNLQIQKSTKRVCVVVWVDGKRYRYSNGNRIKLSINPNRLKPGRDRLAEGYRLVTAFREELKNGWTPTEQVNDLQEIQLKAYLKLRLLVLSGRNYSQTYLRDLRITAHNFSEFKDFAERKIWTLKVEDFKMFLNQYHGRTYNNKRAQLSALLSEFYIHLNQNNVVLQIKRASEVTRLHRPFNETDLRLYFKEVKSYNSNLYLCSLLVFHCLLRPHREIRLLQRRHFDVNYSRISLSGEENKSRRIRVVPIPPNLSVLIKTRFSQDSTGQTYLFGGESPVNPDYFKLLFRRFRMNANLNLIDKTIYSLRHTAAIQVFKRTNELRMVQRLLGHSDIQVTMIYLRSLGEFDEPICLKDLPKI